MTIIYSFLFCGLICLIGQIILDNTSFTPGHITSIFVVLGSFLCSISLYEKILKVVGIGASLPIMSFGNLLTKGAYTGYLENGFIGIFTNILCNVSLGISSVVIFSFFLMLIFKPKD